MNRSLLKTLLPMLMLAFASIESAIAQIPQTINYQGYLTNSASQPVNAAVNVTFRLYTAPSGGAPVWQETQSGIGVANGVFTAVLGSATPLNVPFNVPYFLSLQVNTDAEMAGRQPLSAVPYALRAVSADSVATSATIPAVQLTGTLASSQFAATQLLPTAACTANQFSQWNGTAWICAAGTGTTTTSDVTGNLTMVNSTASAGNVLKGGALFIHSIGSDNAFLGINAGNTAMSGQYNAGLGALVLGQLTNGYGNAAHGAWAMKDNTTGFFNAAGGAFALIKNTSGNSNSGFGMQALAGVTSGNNNIGIGASAGSAITTGSGNIAIGNAADVTDAGVVRIGRANTHVKTFVAGIRGVSPGVADALPVVIDSNGQLGTGSGTGSLVSGTAKIGSTDGAVEILAGDQVAIRIQAPSAYAHGPNISLGSLLNVAGGLAVQAATVGGGGGNTGDTQNSATASYSTIAGGGGNNASGFAGAIAGGMSNSAGSYGAIGGGGNNAASGQYATVGGGNGNVASGNLAIVSGGAFNSALGIASFAAGFRAKAVNNGCFAWADNTNADFSCTTNNAFTARAAGGVYLYTSANLATGCQIPAGGGAWSCTSSRETKTDFTTMNPIDVLTRVASLQMTQWRYRTEVSGARHVGPMAEDFHAAFGLGDSTKTINVMDASGIALAAIQGLHQMVKDKNREIDTLKRDFAAIKKKLGLD